MRGIRFFGLILAVAGLVLAPVCASAQTKVTARTGAHADYSRITFEWNEKPAYSLSKEGARILIRFAKAGTLDAGAVAGGDKNVKKVETQSGAGEPLQVAVTIPDGSRFRDFIVGNKLVIDVYDSGAAAAKSPPSEKTASPKVEEKPAPLAKPEEKPVTKPEAKAEPKAEPKAAPKTAGDFTIQPAQSAATAPTPKVEEPAIIKPVAGEHVVSLTGTFSVGMAAFTRNGVLWIVTDTADIPTPPVVKGPSGDTTPLQKVEIANGAAYRMDVPDGLHAYGEGGGLSWKVILTPAARDAAPVLPAADASAGELVWPLKSMRKELTFDDPVVGDKITVVTASDAKQFAGPARDYINLTSLSSVIGLAFAAKSEDLKTELNTQQVRVGRTGGKLAISGAGHVPAPAQILKTTEPENPEAENPASAETKAAETPDGDDKNMVLTEEAPPASIEDVIAQSHEGADVPASKDELVKAAGEKPGGNNIYNFPRWEMGGLQALNNNQHVLMTEVSSKPDQDRIENIITMAKMNIANNRAPEALGLLRIALQKVPELEGNTEFQSLRGVALALSGKYDESIVDLTRADLMKYDDTKIWRTYALAGLEDWKQAITEMPKDVSPVAAYPKEIRVPISLSLTEVALRAGNVPMAEGILKTMEAEMPKMPLAYAASWKYLSGEADRQAGKTEDAIAHWEPLVKNGKDDLFRAKAGLSLTKLNLDTKKITPADAIDRLEGLRYAWRGDELETLINYRLGQIYMENKDYLKGLTVLRNATTISPGTAIGDDVKNYMTKNFRDIFTKNLLKDVSPLESISIYEEFKDLTPPGEEGDRFVEKLAERMVDAEMLGRASSLLEHHVNNRLKGERKAEIAIRLAAIRLLDGNPDGALRSLEIAQATLNGAPAAAATTPPAGATDATTAAPPSLPAVPAIPDAEKQRQIHLLKARALSMKKKPDDALAILEAMPMDSDVNRLRTDVAWTAGKWDEAAVALNDLIVAEDISARRPVTDYQRDLIFNRAIALNLSGNRVALANLRDRYNAQMKDTTRGQMFEIVTRPRRPDMIGSREAIESMISEIDLFQGFLDGYTKMQEPPSKEVKPAPAAATGAANATKPDAGAQAPAAEPQAVPEPKPADAAAATGSAAQP